MFRRAGTKFTGEKAKAADSNLPLEVAARPVQIESEGKRKHSSDSTSQQDVSSEPEAKRLKTAPTSSSEVESPAPGRSAVAHASGPRRLSEAVGGAAGEPFPKPKAQKIKQAGRSKPESQSHREAEVPRSSNPEAKRLPAVRTIEHKNRSSKSFELSDLEAVGDLSSLQLRPQDVATPALAQSSSTLGLSGAAGGHKTTPVDATNIPQEWIKFGTLRCLDDPKSSIALRAPSQGLSCYTELVVGRDQSRRITVTGLHVGKHLGKLILEQSKSDKLPLRRRVWVKRTDVASPISRTSLWKGKGCVQVGKSEVLSDGDRVQFGNGPWFKYEPPKLFDLYKLQGHVYGDDDTNSDVIRVQRRCDDVSFVAKMIDQNHTRMADREMEAFNLLGYHPNITQFVEAFYDKREGIDYLVLEAAQDDLDTYVSRLGPHRHRNIIDQAPQIIAQASSAIAHVHSHEMAHRDIKPENLLISITELGHIKLKLCDFGLARSGPQAMSEKKWRAGTPGWMAPASFMMYPSDDRLVDCYGIGRILYFLLSSSPWPKESENADAKCGCRKACPSICVRRTLAFNTLINAGMGENCLDFLQHLLVGDPDDCMDIGEVLTHPYLTNAVSHLTT